MAKRKRKRRRRRRYATPSKARKILRHGTIRGRALTRKQRGLFGVLASGKRPRRRRAS